MGRYIQGLLLCLAGGSLSIEHPFAGLALIAAGICGTISAVYSSLSLSRARSER